MQYLRDEAEPVEYGTTLDAIRAIGVAALIRGIAAYATERYEAASAIRNAEIDESGGIFRIRPEKNKSDREVYRWLGVANIEYIARQFEEDTRLASMSNEEIAAECKASAIKAAEDALALALAGKAPCRAL